jgi:hypothetical protein
VIENKPGANSIVGADLVAKSPADGYTVLTVIAAHAANATLYAGQAAVRSGEGLHAGVARCDRAAHPHREQRLPACAT